MTADRKLSHAELRDIIARHKREGQKYDDLGMCLTHILLAEKEYDELWARAEKYREALEVVRQFGVFTTYDPKASDQENDELQRRYRRIRKALDEALLPVPQQERDAGAEG